jgi:ferric iron reductase protein FhuF
MAVFLIIIFILVTLAFFAQLIRDVTLLRKNSNILKNHIIDRYNGSQFNIYDFNESIHDEIRDFNNKVKQLNGAVILIAKPENLLKPSNLLPNNFQNFIKINNHPQICMGIGILGTFTGLTVGLMNLHGSFTNSDILLQKVEGLLQGMNLAFITSLIGMLTSIIGSIYINKIKSAVKEDFLAIYSHIRSKIDCVDPMEYYFSTKETAKESDAEIDYRIIDLVKNNLDVNIDTAKATTAMNTDLATSITRGFSEAINPTLQNLNESIDGFVSDNKNGAQDAIGRIIQNLEQSMMEMVGQFKDMISEDTKNELEAMANMLSESGQYFVKIPEVLETILTQIEDQQNQQKVHYKEINTNLDSSLENFNWEINRYNQSIQKFDETQNLFGNTLNQFDQFLRHEQDSHERIERTFSTFGSTMDEQSSTMQRTLEKMGSFMQELNTLGGDMDNIFRALHSNVSQYEQEVGGSLNTYLDGYSKAIDEFTNRMETAVNSMQGLLSEIQDQELVRR